ncbi:hypothetical protein [Staphylococcus borealis]|uniref:hypothetical protein n=1 Tax=Staphylococcus borealis TaxID=2742203 RepID=UPI002A81A7B9|nr:hypothetical protein [Staphylococcus borealis]MDY4023299.1 hypothetical protein [Staphylococcus borealis]
MSTIIFTNILNIAKNIDYAKILKESSRYIPYVTKAKDILGEIIKEKQEANEKGQTAQQYYYSKVKEVSNTVLENIDIDDFISNQFNKITSNIKETIAEKIGIEDIDEFLELYKDFLDGNDNNIEKITTYIQSMLENVFKNDSLKEKIGESAFNTLMSLIINFGLKISRITYQFSIEKINDSEFKKAIRTFTENYILSLIKFISGNEKLKDYANDIIKFATGDKATSIFSLIGKVTNFIANKTVELNVNKINIFDIANNMLKKVKNMNPLKVLGKEKKYEDY